MVNCNPETVSTDYDTSDRLYFEPLGVEEVLAICEREQPVGVVIQFGGQTPLKLARALEEAGYRDPRARRSTRSTSPRTASASARCSTELGIRCPEWGIATEPRRGGRASRERIGYPVLVRPSYVLGGRAMRVCYDAGRRARRDAAARTGTCSSTASSRTRSRSTSTRSATATDTYVGAVMQHVEEAGVHSGDSRLRAAGAVADAARARARSRTSCGALGARARRRRAR